MHFQIDFEDKKKSLGTSYIMMIFLGSHYAYLGNWSKCILFWFTLLFLIGFFWAFVDLFRMKTIVTDYNNKLAQRIILQSKMIYRK
jgi:succinate dehydrogenase hydrophobic anchor subunit